ncbi:MAG TPA: c-type cytochrome domain-containing protein, partial [Bryobacteraceae bacterium]|nr:c-type cytochrome domain-containing protein [Bryobacteraceae bacterium]
MRILCGGLLLIGCVRAADKVDFTKDIQPIFEKSCYGCHGPKQQMAGLRLDLPAAKVVQPAKPEESALYQRIAGLSDQARMPMGGKPLPPEQIALIKTWIEQGAQWPENAASPVTAAPRHWAFIAPQRPAL